MLVLRISHFVHKLDACVEGMGTDWSLYHVYFMVCCASPLAVRSAVFCLKGPCDGFWASSNEILVDKM